MKRSDILPAILRPGMYTGERGDRTVEEHIADAIVAYLEAKERIMTYPDGGTTF